MQSIVKGFPQFQDFTYLNSKYYGTTATQAVKTHTDVNVQSGTVGDPIQVDSDTVGLLTVVRDGAVLMVEEGFEIIAPNVLRLYPGLLATESVEFKFLTGVSGVLNYIPVAPPVPSADGYDQTVSEALVYTDNSQLPVGAFPPTLVAGKTRITTQFEIDAGRLDIYINGRRAGAHSGVWSIIDQNTIELNDNYSTVTMQVEIVKQIVGL